MRKFKKSKGSWKKKALIQTDKTNIIDNCNFTELSIFIKQLYVYLPAKIHKNICSNRNNS